MAVIIIFFKSMLSLYPILSWKHLMSHSSIFLLFSNLITRVIIVPAQSGGAYVTANTFHQGILSNMNKIPVIFFIWNKYSSNLLTEYTR